MFLTVCTPGEYYKNDTGECVPCLRNTYQPSPRQFACINCPEGTLTQRDRSTLPNDCLYGKNFVQIFFA